MKDQINEFEVENDTLKVRLEVRNKEVKVAKEMLEQSQQDQAKYKNVDKIELQNIERIGQLEGQLLFKDNEIEQLTEQLQFELKQRQL